MLFSWFYYPFPAGADYGAMHRYNAAELLAIANVEANISPASVLLYLCFAACISLPSFLLQLFGSVLAARRFHDVRFRIVLIATLGHTIVFVIAPARTDRYLIPGLVFLWPLGGAFCAEFLARFSVTRRLDRIRCDACMHIPAARDRRRCNVKTGFGGRRDITIRRRTDREQDSNLDESLLGVS